MTQAVRVVNTLTALNELGQPVSVRPVSIAGMAQLTNRPINNEVSFYGDSRVANSLLIAGANYNMTTRSIGAWVRNLCRQSIRFNFNNVHGVGGYKSDEVLALLQANLATDTAGVICVLCSTNDRAASPTPYTLAQTIANLQAIEDLITQSGRICVWLTEMPRGGSNVLTGTPLKNHLSIVRWLLQRSIQPGVFVADTFSPLVDLTSASASPQAGMMGGDGLHLASIGCYYAALEVKKIMDILFPAVPVLSIGAASGYDATDNPRGALNANPMFTGTGGTKTAGAGTLSGNLGDNYTCTLNNATGLTCVLSQVIVNGKAWQQMVLSGTPTSASPGVQVFANTSIASLITAGDQLEQTVEWEIDAGQTGILEIMNVASLSGLTRRDLAGDATLAPVLPNVAMSMVSKLGPIMAGSPETGFYKPGFVVDCIQNVAVSATIRFRALEARKVV
jgi:hypothetical protein